ncbi:MAG: cell wall hydrolase [Alphaproteobacteria bacterium]
MASSLYPSMRRASFALAQPLQLEEVSPRVVLARLSGAQERAPEARVTGRFDMPVVGAGASRPLVYPVVNRQTKGDLLAERPKVRATIPSPRADAGLLAAPDVLAATSTFVRRPWGEAVNGGDLASTSDLGGAQLAAGRLNDNLSDAAPLARFGLSVPAPDMVEALTEPHSAGDEPDSAPTAEQPAITPRYVERLEEGVAGIEITGEGPLARAGAGVGAPSVPLESEPFRVSTTHEPVAGFDPILSATSTDRRGDRPDPVLVRLLQMAPPEVVTLQPGQPSAEFALATRLAGGRHPALILSLNGRARERAQRCLAEAVYWEARSEPELGQKAVAQVVVNRAVSGFYPADICGVVYQNAHRYLSCQFTFACEGRRSLVPTEQEPWTRAQTIATEMIEGRVWLDDVGHATHYHANYVRPWWARSMRKMQRIGLHIFYRPRDWGTGPRVTLAQANLTQ